VNIVNGSNTVVFSSFRLIIIIRYIMYEKMQTIVK